MHYFMKRSALCVVDATYYYFKSISSASQVYKSDYSLFLLLCNGLGLRPEKIGAEFPESAFPLPFLVDRFYCRHFVFSDILNSKLRSTFAFVI
jgi:hypothetical protein